jgi:hypothetical protein
MGIACSLGLHTWNRCICTKCGKRRDKGHDWSINCEKCHICGKTRENVHSWVGCKCSKCRTIRDEAHDWNGCKCRICHKIRDEEHGWTVNCEKCYICGKTRANVHSWVGCKCSNCPQTRDEGHDWKKDCEKCARCGRTRDNAHDYHGCKCIKCGKIRDVGHEIEDNICRVCGSPISAAQLWAEGLAKEGNYQELARLVAQFNYELNEHDQQRRKYARLELLAAGEAVVDVVAGMITQNGVDHGDLAEILIASNSKLAVLPLLSQFRDMSSSPSKVEKMIRFFIKMKAVEVAPGLVALLKSDYYGTRSLAAQALGQLEIAETTDALLEAVEGGDPYVHSGLLQARTQFAMTILGNFEKRRSGTTKKFETMSEADMLKIMQSFASAYLQDDNKTRDQLEFTVKDIGQELSRRGGQAAMRKMLQNFKGPANRHIDRVWSGIGGWQG